MMRNKELFDLIHAFGPNYGNNIHVVDNTKDGSDGFIIYRVWIIDGTCFEICKLDESYEHYDFYPVWEGPFKCKNAIIALYILAIFKDL